MMHAQEKMSDLEDDVVLSLKLSSMRGPRNILTIHSNGRAISQPDFDTEPVCLDLSSKDVTSVENYLRDNLPVKSFLELKDNYYSIPSNGATCGTAANLFLRIGTSENWVGVWNYGRGDIPSNVDAGMYDAVIKLANQLVN